MDQRSCRVLILDSDPDTLIALQHLLEHAEFDTTITWDKAEACRLLKTEPFALVLIGDHPPELDAAAILEDLSLQGASCSSLILRETVREEEVQYFRGLGAIGMLPKRDPLVVLEEVARVLAPRSLNARPKTSLPEGRSWRTAS